MSRETSAYSEIVAEMGAGRQAKNDCFASVLVQVLGVKESADLQEGFGFFVQHLLSGGLEEAHSTGRGGAGGKGPENAQGKEKGGIGGKAAEEAQEEEGRVEGEVMDRGGSMEKEEELVGALARLDISQGDSGGGRGGGKPKHSSAASRGEERRSSEAANGAAGGRGRGGKNGQWRENLKGREWERYVDGMAWILEHGGGEVREFRCSHCSERGSSNGGDMQGNGIPKGMYVSGVGATEFALAFATELSKSESCGEACMYIFDGSNANKARVEEAAEASAVGDASASSAAASATTWGKVAVGQQLTPVAVGQQLTPVAVGQQLTPVAVGQQLTPVAVGQQLTPVAVGQQLTPVAVGQQLTPVAVGQQLTPVAVGQQLTPVAVGQQLTPVAVGQQLTRLGEQQT
ncbi:unnamed protein product [Closterium sp. Naga37s-1]|nr:unnamed protein product [Closterium sp. Naga37s-1]